MTLPEVEESCSQGPPSKRLKLDQRSEDTSSSNKSTELLDICDDLLLEILSYVKPSDLLTLSQCCQRLNCVVRDRTLWKNVDLRNEQMTGKDLLKFTSFFLPITRLIATKGTWDLQLIPEWDGEEQWSVIITERDGGSSQDLVPTITLNLLKDISIKAPNLSSLILENHIINCDDVRHHKIWELLPCGLENLTLKSCHLTKCIQSGSFFGGICGCFPRLKKLDLSGSLWFEPHSLLALSKCQQLEELNLADCLLREFVPYISLSTRFGFKSLRVVDLRRTWVSDREISCLDKMPTLQELYLESPRGARDMTLVTDLGVTAFGGTQEEWNQMGYIVMHIEGVDVENVVPSPLKILELCNYISVTDTSLRHCASCLKGLKKLNIKGTSCTLAGVIKFKTQRPDVVIQSDFNLEVKDDLQSSEGNT